LRYLFVHQNFPGQYLHLVRHLAAQERHEIVFLSEMNENAIAGVRKMVYPAPSESPPGVQGAAREFDQAMQRAGLVGRAGRTLRGLGFVPDIIIGHHGWGELLDLGDVWPGAPVLGYCEFYYRLEDSDVDCDPEFPTPAAMLPTIRAKNAVNLLALNNPGHGQTPTRFQLETYPAWARKRITVLPEGVDLDRCRPDPAARTRPFRLGDMHVLPGEKLITYVARDLEPYRGFHTLMRALPRILGERGDTQAVLVGGDGVSYGAKLAESTWREWLLREVGGRLPPGRVHFAGRVAYEDYVRLLQRSDAHVYLTYPFVASWSLREALACGCTLVGSDTAPVREFVQDGTNGLLAPLLDPARLAERVLEALGDEALATRLRQGARCYAEATLRLADHITSYETLIRRLTRG
jgi:glycosyltransferase involved in cell wall biosynthesis